MSKQLDLGFPGGPGDVLTPQPGCELFFGLVGPTGSDADSVYQELAGQLRAIGYDTELISFSDLIRRESGVQGFGPSEYDRIRLLMEKGTDLREASGLGDYVARLALGEIRRRRKAKTGDRNEAAKKTAYILKSFKRREEVDLFRIIYGKQFNLISVYASEEERLSRLTRKIASSERKPPSGVEDRARELIRIDGAEEDRPLGQSVRETFPLADYFVLIKDSLPLSIQLRRLVHLVFGNPYLTPTKDEYAMFLAQAAALRSGDLSRQVGATIVSDDGEVISAGCNEVPKAGGGLYWSDDRFPRRDFEVGYDKNTKVKQELVEDMLGRLSSAKWLATQVATLSPHELFAKAVTEEDAPLKDSPMLDVIEYGRAVHAEMAAITDAARRGLPIRGARLFCTTFPCHLCARHIISAGIKEVLYIEPYPKSRTPDLYSDSVVINPTKLAAGMVNFLPFIGVAPRRYFDFFQLEGTRKTDHGEIVNWVEREKEPKVRRFVLSYLRVEQVVVASMALPEDDNTEEPK